MVRCLIAVLFLLLPIALCVGPVARGEDVTAKLQPLLQAYCVSCHGEGGEPEGDVDLTLLKSGLDASHDLHLLGRLVEAVEHNEMPPEDEAQPTEAERHALLSAFETLLHKALGAQQRVARVPVRRMNRFQYNNAVTDLFDLKCVVFTLPERMMREHKNYFQPETGRMAATVVVGSRPLGKSQMIEPRLAGVAPFPQDLRAEHGFDNRGDHLSLSPLLMEAFMKLSQSVTQSPDFVRKNVGIWDDFFSSPDATDDIEKVVHDRLRPFLTKAFRRPIGDEVLFRYADFVLAQLDRGVDFSEAMRAVAAAAIASPKFLYLYDEANATQSLEPLNAFELASRLSFFLWGSLPDEELLQLATAGQLSDASYLADQVERMLHDKKLKRFCDSFPAQWLQLERIISAMPDRELFPDFYYLKYRDSMHMMIEPLLLFETVLIENRPITQLVDSDFTYRSLLLREAYREEISSEDKKKGRNSEVMTLTFRRQPVTDRRYGGVITNAAVMTMTSGSNRTQPITRGAWLATVIFNDPPDPPPADVPPLAEEPAVGEEDLTLRERLAMHRERADCRGCHEQIDPLGFALENYDPIGVWRDAYDNGRKIEVADKLFRKRPFSDVVEFKDAILEERDRFAEGFVGHLLSFALARELDAADSVEVKRIAEDVAADDYRIQTAIKRIVLSKPFRNKSNSTETSRDGQN